MDFPADGNIKKNISTKSIKKRYIEKVKPVNFLLVYS
jgi:hypothetical protein